jgi:hypothetical protein
MGKKKTKKQLGIRLNLDRTFEFVKGKRDGGKFEDKDKNKVRFSPDSVFYERKPRFLRGRRKVILYVEGLPKALKFKETDVKEGKKTSLENPNPHWTMKESQEFVDRQIAESLEDQKPLTWLQFFILAVPVVVTLIVVIAGFGNLGAL